MSTYAAFCLGFALATVVSAICAYFHCRSFERETREEGYRDGYNAAEAGIRRELGRRFLP